jgi:hypothetical protein
VSRLLIVVLMACTSGLMLEAQSKPPASRSHLDGNWQLEDALVPENPKNWQRPTASSSGSTSGSGRTGGSGVNMQPCIELPPRQELDGTRAPSVPCAQPSGPYIKDAGGIAALRTVGKTLIAESQKLSIAAGPRAITIGDDFFDPTLFTMSWRGYRLAVPTGRTKLRMYYSTVVVKTRWEGDALVQDLSGTNAGGFKLRRVFKLAEDGKRLLMLIHVEKPKITPPVEDMTRAYVREGK